MFRGWDNYFFMTGSAAASLIGLLFIVVTLTSNFERSRAMRGAAIYMTPTAVHFAVVLGVSAVFLAPRVSAEASAILVGAAIVAGLANAIRTSLGIRALASNEDPPHWSDFWWYGAAPAVVYVGVGLAAAGLAAQAAWSVYVIAALLLMLLLVGIRNAWDLITWMAPQGTLDPAQLKPPPK